MAEAIFTDPRRARVWYAVLQPYDPAIEATATIRVATRDVATAPDDAPANVMFEGVLAAGPRYERSMFSAQAIGGRSLPDRGTLDIVNTGLFDAWLAYQWEGRAVEVRMGFAGDRFADAAVVFTGTCGEPTAEPASIVLPLRDKAEALDKLVQENRLYAGTGGLEGGDDLKEKPKPLAFGAFRNAAPVEVDTTNRVFQVHDGPIQAISAVYENGRLLTLTTHYTVDLANGRFTLVSAPLGLITCDGQGSKTGGVYVETVADVGRRLVKDFGGLTDADLDLASFIALNSATGAPVQFYVGAEPVNLMDMLDQVVQSIGGFWGFNRAGLFQVARLEAPTGSPAATLTDFDIVEDGVTREPFGAASWRRRLNWGRNWTVMSPQGLDPAATAAYRAFAVQEFRTAKAEDATVKEDGPGKGGHRAAVDPEPDSTLLAVESDADAEVARRLALFGTGRFVYRVDCKTQPYQLDLGQTVRLVHRRYGLAAGKNLVVVGIGEDAADDAASVYLWG